MKLKTLTLATIGILLLSGCSSMRLAEFSGQTPELILEEYFSGELFAWGMFQDRSGAVKRRFSVRLLGTRDGDRLTLAEDFCYADGTRDHRTWYITKVGDGRYIGRADDVIGEAVGESAGNALHWTYQLSLPVDDRVFEVSFDDWMFLQSPDILINRAVMKKWGVRLGEVTLVFSHQPPRTPWDASCVNQKERST